MTRGRQVARFVNNEQRRSSSARPPRRRREKDYWRLRRSSSAPPQPEPKKIEWTPAERQVIQKFFVEAVKAMCAYVDMTDEELMEEYRLAGKPHKCDPLTEIHKRYARVAKKYRLPEDFDPKLEDHLKLIEDEDYL